MVRWWWYGTCRSDAKVGLFPDFFPLRSAENGRVSGGGLCVGDVVIDKFVLFQKRSEWEVFSALSVLVNVRPMDPSVDGGVIALSD